MHSDSASTSGVTARALARVSEAKGRADAATPGPWGMGERLLDNDPIGAWDIFAHDTDLVEEGDIGSGACVLASRAPWGHYADRSIANGNFIAHARADVPLLATIAAAAVRLVAGSPAIDREWWRLDDGGCIACPAAEASGITIHAANCPAMQLDAAICAAGEVTA